MIRGDFMEENIVCVVARDKHTGYVKTCTSCDIENANKYAKYYRSVGYNSQIVTYEKLHEILEKEKKERMNNMLFRS